MSSSSLDLAFWYLGRGTGVVSLVLLTLVVALGIATRSGRPLPGLPRFAVAAVHRNAGLLAVVLLVLHVGTLLLDPVAQLRLLDLVLPFVGSYRPLWLGLGTLGLDMMVALIVTSLLRARIGVRAWRAVHWLAYAAWPVALLHSLGTGTDAGTPWLRAIAAGCLALVAAAVAWRTSTGFSDATGGRRGIGVPAAPHRRPDVLR
ncbi:MAG: methionine sulfoxide reductase heme-binding subunit [Actinomycetota bacterium]|jgi:sulfoxide reductase heme-binding subunit YedZ|nr:methionine sulfoxide reductase heme-binding subunit [Actinomycetota bacterium]